LTRRRLQFLLLGSVAFAACLVAACAEIFNIHNAETDSGAVIDGGADVVDAPYDYMVFDAIDFDVNTAMCGDGGVPFVSADAAVWVSAKTGIGGSGCGTQAQPCNTIAQALANRGGRNVIYLDDSIFQEIVQLASAQSGITLQGGWIQGDAGWQAVCDNTKSIIQGQDAGGPAAIEITTTNNVTLRLLTVKSKQSGANGGGTTENVYAIRAIDAPGLTLDNVTLISQNAGGGSPGSTPQNPPFCTTNGSNGQPGSVGTAGLPGVFAGSDFSVSTAGQGSTGNAGSYTGPTNGQCGNCNAGCP
jgi:hypothetical protein